MQQFDLNLAFLPGTVGYKLDTTIQNDEPKEFKYTASTIESESLMRKLEESESNEDLAQIYTQINCLPESEYKDELLVMFKIKSKPKSHKRTNYVKYSTKKINTISKLHEANSIEEVDEVITLLNYHPYINAGKDFRLDIADSILSNVEQLRSEEDLYVFINELLESKEYFDTKQRHKELYNAKSVNEVKDILSTVSSTFSSYEKMTQDSIATLFINNKKVYLSNSVIEQDIKAYKKKSNLVSDTITEKNKYGVFS